MFPQVSIDIETTEIYDSSFEILMAKTNRANDSLKMYAYSILRAQLIHSRLLKNSNFYFLQANEPTRR